MNQPPPNWIKNIKDFRKENPSWYWTFREEVNQEKPKLQNCNSQYSGFNHDLPRILHDMGKDLNDILINYC